jgi:hypothetical protein
MLRASLTAARLAAAGEEAQWAVLREVGALLAERLPGRPPIEVSPAAQRIVRRITGVEDPFAAAKRRANRELLALLPRLRAEARAADDPLAHLLRLAAAGNAVDLGAKSSYRLDEVTQAGPWGRFDYPAFLEQLERAGEVLLIADNAGEIVLDRLLCEEFAHRGKRVLVAVRGAPTLNDATLEDAREVGLTQVAQVITTGQDHPGVFLPQVSPEFRERFRGAGLVIAKGMGNFEGLSEEAGPLFFLLKAKCAPVAQALGVEVGELVLAGPGLTGAGEKGQS